MRLTDRKCSGCQELKHESEFPPSVLRRHGGYCRACYKERYAKSAAAADVRAKAARAEKLRAAGIHKCSRCQELKSASEFAPSRGRNRDGGYCSACRKIRRAESAARPLPTIYKCSRCQELKPVGEFAPSIVATKSGGYCKPCRKLRAIEGGDEMRAAERVRERARRANPEYKAAQYRREVARRARIAASPELAAKADRQQRNKGLQRRYGLTLAEYEARLASQNGRCACCGSTAVGRTGSRARIHLMVDHDHETGEIRGLVCHGCNVGIAQLGDDIGGVRRALTYLEKPDMAGVSAGWLF